MGTRSGKCTEAARPDRLNHPPGAGRCRRRACLDALPRFLAAQRVAMKTSTRRSLRRAWPPNLAGLSSHHVRARDGSRLRHRGRALSRRNRTTLRCDSRHAHHLPGRAAIDDTPTLAHQARNSSAARRKHGASAGLETGPFRPGCMRSYGRQGCRRSASKPGG